MAKSMKELRAFLKEEQLDSYRPDVLEFYKSDPLSKWLEHCPEEAYPTADEVQGFEQELEDKFVDGVHDNFKKQIGMVEEQDYGKAKKENRLNRIERTLDYAEKIDIITAPKQIYADYRGEIKELRARLVSSGESEKHLPLRVIALIYFYSGDPITLENATKTAINHGHKSGRALYYRYLHYADRGNRIHPKGPRADKAHLKRLKTVIDLLTDKRANTKAQDDLNTFKAATGLT